MYNGKQGNDRNFLRKILDLRGGQGDTARRFMAERLGIARSTYAGYEAGKRSPNVEMIAKLSKELYVSVDELLGRYDYGTPNLIRDAWQSIL